MEDKAKEQVVRKQFQYLWMGECIYEHITSVTQEMTDFVKPHVEQIEFIRVGHRMMVCLLTLANGFEVVGEASTINPDKFHWEIGCKYALKDAVNKASTVIAYMECGKRFEGLTYKQDEPAASL